MYPPFRLMIRLNFTVKLQTQSSDGATFGNFVESSFGIALSAAVTLYNSFDILKFYSLQGGDEFRKGPNVIGSQIWSTRRCYSQTLLNNFHFYCWTKKAL